MNETLGAYGNVRSIKIKLFHDNFQNYKQYNIPRAQFVIADIPFNMGNFAYGSNPSWYVGGDNKNGQSDKAGKSFFSTDNNFNVHEYMHFCSNLLVKEPKETGKAPCMVIFCEFEQQFELIKLAQEFGFKNYINLVFRKNFSAQVLKANMRIVGNCEYGLVLFRDKLPKFNNDGKMIYNCFDVERDTNTPKIHPTQKSLPLLERLIKIFTDEKDVVIDPVAGSASTLLAALNCGRSAYGFEVSKEFFNKANDLLNERLSIYEDIQKNGYAVGGLGKLNSSLFD